MVGFSRAVVAALAAAASVAALPQRGGNGNGNNGNGNGNNGNGNGNGNGGGNSGGSTKLPIVDLGYAVHQAVSGNDTIYPYYNFSNIRYADPPVGELRFAAPQPVSTTNRTINTGSEARICLQAQPGWTSLKTYTEANLTLSELRKQGPTESEDCLFLDVFVPKRVFDSEKGRRTRKKHGKASVGAPVLVWIYGGGYTGGNKAGINPTNLISQADENDGEGIVFVAFNYRLGLFGFMAGSTWQTNATANAGFHDQRLALEWIQENIHLFGGDPDRVTVMGESAGGGSILYQITAYGGLKGPAPFARAIAQSPGVQPITTNVQKEEIFEKTLAAATKWSGSEVTSVQELRNLNLTTLYRTNAYVVGLSQQGTWTYGPMVDGDFAPKPAQEMLLHGKYDKDVEIMVGHQADEGRLLTDSRITTQAQFRDLITVLAPSAPKKAIDYITEELYPEVYDGQYGYTNAFERVALLISETGFTCYTRAMMKAKEGEGYSYLFSVPPAIHGQDVPFTFYNPEQPTVDFFGVPFPINATVATTMQRYFVNFAQHGTPNVGADVPWFPQYGQNETITNLGVKGIPLYQLDTVSNQPNGTNNAGDRCDWFQKGLYY